MAHGDYTGQRKSALAQEYADQQRLAATGMSMVQQTVREGRNEVIDLRNEIDLYNEKHRMVRNPEAEDGVEVVDVEDPTMQPVKFRCSESLDQVTVGKDREFNLEEGRIYMAPRWVVEHLDDKGLVYH